MSNLIQDVRQFQQEILGNNFPNKPQLLEGKALDYTIEKLEEELNELAEAETIADQADALVDLIYLALGGLHQAGVDTQRVWDAVQHANMTKKRGMTHRGHDNDAAKPEGWKAPDHSWLDRAAKTIIIKEPIY